MNTFLSDEQYQLILDMRQLRTGQGGKYKWLLGVNVCTILESEVKADTNGKPYIAVRFVRKPQEVLGRRIYFSPHEEYFFTYDDLRRLCVACGHELKPRPEGYQVLDYFKAVSRRMKTFTAELNVVMGVVRKIKRDEYGKPVINFTYGYNLEVYDYRILNYTGEVNWKEIYTKLNY